MKPYTVMVQASPEEILALKTIKGTLIEYLTSWPNINHVVVVMPIGKHSEEAKNHLNSFVGAHWEKLTILSGHPSNLCIRMMNAHEWMKYYLQSEKELDPFIVRMCLYWTPDMPFVDQMVKLMRKADCDAVLTSPDFDIVFGADIVSIATLKKINEMYDDSTAFGARALFCPWGYLDLCSTLNDPNHRFNVIHMADEDIRLGDEEYGLYQKKQTKAREQLPEHETWGTDSPITSYDHIVWMNIPTSDDSVLDFSCGSGEGTAILSKYARKILGVDYKESSRWSDFKQENLSFEIGDIQTWNSSGSRQFDVVISLHTIEHVPDDKAALMTLYRSIKSGGMLILEVPKATDFPFSEPSNPHHLREYHLSDLLELLSITDLEITRVQGGCRGFYGQPLIARDAFRIYARKK